MRSSTSPVTFGDSAGVRGFGLGVLNSVIGSKRSSGNSKGADRSEDTDVRPGEG